MYGAETWIFMVPKVELYGAESELYGAESELYGAETELYGAELELYGAELCCAFYGATKVRHHITLSSAP